jgi:cyclophilin family peptidyl-prolyl cis-trans isomerase
LDGKHVVFGKVIDGMVSLFQYAPDMSLTLLLYTYRHFS